MSDPFTTVLAAGAVGAATKEIISKAWDSGKGWLTAHYENHQKEVRRKADA